MGSWYVTETTDGDGERVFFVGTEPGFDDVAWVYPQINEAEFVKMLATLSPSHSSRSER